MFGRALIATIAALALIPSASAGDKGLMGALIGAGAGAAIGHSVDRTGGAGKGAAIGAIGGYIIGSQMDKSDDRAKQQGAQRPSTSGKQGTALRSTDCNKAQTYLDKATAAKNIERQIYLLEKSTRLCPNDPRLHNDLGVAYHSRGKSFDRKRARDELEEALRLDPGYKVARDNLRKL